MIGSQTITWGNVHASTVFVVTPEGICSAVKRAHITVTCVTFSTMTIGGVEHIWDVEDFETIEINISVSECAVEEESLFTNELADILAGEDFVEDPITTFLFDANERDVQRMMRG